MSAHSSGGSSHVEYMVRETAYRKDTEGRAAKERGWRERVSRAEPEQTIGHERSADLIWTRNAPSFVTGEHDGNEPEQKMHDPESKENRKAKSHQEHEAITERVPALADKVERERAPMKQSMGEQPSAMSFEEKQLNVSTHFGGLLDYEESLGGISHYRFVATVSRNVATVEGLKLTVNDFLRNSFPNNPTLICIHPDTENLHAHILVLSRQLDGTRVDLKGDYFRLDEKWMKAASEHFKEPDIYIEHFKLKQSTREWKRQARGARAEGRPIPPKPDRHRDHWEVWNSDKPWNDFWCGRVAYALKTHEMKLRYQTLTNAKPEELAQTGKEVSRLRQKYEDAAELRRSAPDRQGRLPGEAGFSRSAEKQRMPPEIPTISEKEQIRDYHRWMREARVRQKAELTEQMRGPLREVADRYLRELTSDSYLRIHEQPKLLELHTGWMHNQLLRTFKEQHLALDQTNYTTEGLTDYCRGELMENSAHAHEQHLLDVEREQNLAEMRRQHTEQLLPHLNQVATLHLREINGREYLAALRDKEQHSQLVGDLSNRIGGSIMERGLALDRTEVTEDSLRQWVGEQVTRIGMELEQSAEHNLTPDNQQRTEEQTRSYGTFETWDDHGFIDFGGR